MINKTIFSSIFAAVGWFFVPIQWYLLFNCFLVLVDLYTGWKASNMKFISRGVRRTIDKMTMYFFAVIVAHGFDLLYLPEGRLLLSFATSSVIASTEVLSIFENIQRTTGTGVGGLFKKFIGNGKP